MYAKFFSSDSNLYFYIGGVHSPTYQTIDEKAEVTFVPANTPITLFNGDKIKIFRGKTISLSGKEIKLESV